MDDTHAIQEFLETGSPDAFQVLVNRYKEKVFRLAISVLGRGMEAEAEDVTQDVFVRVFRQLKTFRGESKFSTWLYRITYNQAIDRRHLARFRMPHYGEDVLAMMPAEKRGDSPFDATLDTQRREMIQECLNHLPDLYRTVLHLYYWMGCSVEEISEALGATTGTVKSYLYRARQRLHAQLARKGVSHV